MDKPVVALAVPPERATSYKNYFAALRAAGAEPVAAWGTFDITRLGGLLLPGGGDVEPSRYHRENRGSANIDPALDEGQLAALDAFVKAGRPVLGVCRGHQLINVYFGGALIQDIATREDHVAKDEKDNRHDTTARPGCFLAMLYGEAFRVNSSHHQAVETLGAGLRAVQWAPDGIVEALCHETLPIHAVQWHPERMCLEHARGDTVDGMALLKWFIGEIDNQLIHRA